MLCNRPCLQSWQRPARGGRREKLSILNPDGDVQVLRSARLHVVLEDVEGCSSPRRVWCEKNRFVFLFGELAAGLAVRRYSCKH